MTDLSKTELSNRIKKKKSRINDIVKCLVIARTEEEGMSIRQIVQCYNINKKQL
jgi:hypothetical protein